MANTPRVANGGVLTWGTNTALDALEIINVTHAGSSRDAINTSHQGTTGNHTLMPGDLKEPGTLTVEAHLPGDLMDAVETAHAAAAETITYKFKQLSTEATSPPQVSSSGFIVEKEWGANLGEKVMLTLTVQWSGATTYADST